MNVLITGANGFLGKNLVAHLERITAHKLFRFNRNTPPQEKVDLLQQVDCVFHVAGVNRPRQEEEFHSGNVEFTAQLCDLLAGTGRRIPLIFASSTQARLDNPYGRSKRAAEERLQEYARRTGSGVAIYRLPNVFGKWCRPHYNSVIATFCHNIAHDLPITISDADRQLNLVYVDDVVCALLGLLGEIAEQKLAGIEFRQVAPLYTYTLGELATLIQSFRRLRTTLYLPDFANPFVHKLYATYLSYLDPDALAYALEQRTDARGALAEFVKAPGFGQIFVSRTKPGITRGNHFHHTKTEKFLVLAGQALIRFQHILSGNLIQYPVRGDEYRVVDIPPGYSHSIKNVGDTELVTLFWASEIFEPARPDTYLLPITESNPLAGSNPSPESTS